MKTIAVYANKGAKYFEEQLITNRKKKFRTLGRYSK